MLKDFNLNLITDSVKVKSNFHAHNYLCGHAGGTVSDYVKEAVARGYEIIGISDHCAPPLGTPLPYMTLETLPTRYLPQFDKAIETYGDKITILSAVEIEYFAGFDEYYEQLLSYLDYLVLGQHVFICNGKLKSSFADGDTEENIVAYCESVVNGIKSGFFALIAHPDIIFYQKPKLTRAVCDAFDNVVREAALNGVAIELNANGIRYHNFNYPTDLLVDLCLKYNAKVTVSADCHSPKDLCDKYVLQLYGYAVNRKLNLVDRII